MKRKNVGMFLGLTSLLISMLACSLGSPAPSDTSSNDPNPEATAASEESAAPTEAAATEEAANPSAGACSNPYLPIVQGATWNYNLTGPVPDTFTRSIISVESTGFTDQDVFGTGVTRQGQWACDNGALTALDPTSGNTASVNTENVTVDFQTTAASGVTLPAALNPGDTWTQTITLEGTEEINGLQIPASNEFSNACTVAGPESVTVAAGAFDTVRVDCTTNMNITLTMNGVPISQPITFTATSWYALNVGLIKTVSSGSGLDSTIELTSYSIP